MSKDVYRHAASILVLRSSPLCDPKGCGKVYQVLLVNKPRKRDNWQLPQGGVEGKESVTEAALRELKEEAGLGKVKILKKSKHIYQYDFPASYRRARPDHVCGQRIEYILAVVSSDCMVQVDDHEIVGYVWVFPDQLSQYIKRKEYRDFVKKLIREAHAY